MEDILKELVVQLTRIADLMENQEKRDIVTKKQNIKQVKEAVKARKDELLRDIASQSRRNTRRD